MQRDRYAKPCGGVGYLPIQLFEVDVQGLALRTSRLLILSNTFHVQQFRRGFIQNGGGCFDIFPIDQEFNSAQQVGNEPVHSYHVVVGQETLDSRRIENAFCQQRFWQVLGAES
jgi:hypothetical protein